MVLVFVSLCTAAPHDAIVGGKLHDRQMDFAHAAFDEVPEETLRLLVMHHHLVPVPGGEGGHPLPRAHHWLELIEEMRARRANAVYLPDITLPAGVAPTASLEDALQRAEIVVDFSAYPVGTRIVLQDVSDPAATKPIMRFNVDREETDDSSLPVLLRTRRPCRSLGGSGG